MNIRSGPGAGYSWIGSLSNGSTAGITGRVSGGWYELSSGGWVAGNWVVGAGGGGGGGGGGGAGAITVATNGSALNIRSDSGAGYGVLGALSNGSTAGITAAFPTAGTNCLAAVGYRVLGFTKIQH
uniref:SH3 domain-containing protein n=1 Tax=Desertifilum tharense IPPAS B-1220 TaxID=1781255 RepID=A0ACD5GVH9_9CYAN